MAKHEIRRLSKRFDDNIPFIEGDDEFKIVRFEQFEDGTGRRHIRIDFEEVLKVEIGSDFSKTLEHSINEIGMWSVAEKGD